MLEAGRKRGEGRSGGDVRGKKWEEVSGWVRARGGVWVGESWTMGWLRRQG